MDTLSSSVSTLTVPNFNPAPRELFFHLRTPNKKRQLPSPSPHPSHFFSTAKTTTFSSNKSTSFTHKSLVTNPPVLSTSSRPTSPFTSPYVHSKPACGYAAALLDIAQFNGSLYAVQKDVRKFIKLLRNGQIQALLSDPFLGDKEKGIAMKELASKGKFDKHLVNLVKMLIQKNKLEMLSEVLEEFERIYDEMCETKLVWILSEKKIGEDRLFRIAKRVQTLSGAGEVKIKNLVRDKPSMPAFAF